MSKKQILTLILALTAFTAEIAFAAELPANVQNVKAEVRNGSLSVTWNAVPGAEFYRVYFSRQSIIGNQGNYDDFERTLAAETAYAFRGMPVDSEQVFVGVLAVDKGGNESEGFETEASVSVEREPAPPVAETPVVTQAEPPQQEPAVEPVLDPLAASGQPGSMPQGTNPTTTAEPMTLVSASAVSSTGVLLTFSKNVSIESAIDAEYFLIVDGSGASLAITRVKVNAATILLETASQTPEKNYLLGILQPIPAGDGTNGAPMAPQVALRGFGIATPVTTAAQGPAGTPAYGQNPMLGGVQPTGYGQNPMLAGLIGPSFLDLSATPRQDGTYDVVARWNGMQGTPSYGLYTSMNGQPFAWNSQVPGQETTVQYNRVKPGTFALRVTARTPQGQESQGIERSVNLPATGAGILGLLAAAGGAAGVRLRRKKMAVV